MFWVIGSCFPQYQSEVMIVKCDERLLGSAACCIMSFSGNRQDMKVGVLALQGTFIEHIGMLRQLGVEAPQVRLPHELDTLDGLIIPGGESTTILRLMESFELIQPVKEMARDGLAIWGTCAGMVLLANSISNYEMETLGLMDMKIRRNAFGSQIDSFEVDLEIPPVGEEPFHAFFIRAPVVKEAKPDVKVLSRLPDSTIVAARQNRLLACAFHPEFTDDLRFHSYFLNMVSQELSHNPKEGILQGSQLGSQRMVSS
jgi:5'-phosphate synthase pdxT subunit